MALAEAKHGRIVSRFVRFAGASAFTMLPPDKSTGLHAELAAVVFLKMPYPLTKS
jgi:hypothetical protein